VAAHEGSHRHKDRDQRGLPPLLLHALPAPTPR
jgi:hypothetical protein